MYHFGGVCNPAPSHVQTMIAFGRELQARGHRFTLFQHPELESKIRASGIEFWPLRVERFADEPLQVFFDKIAQPGGLSLLDELHYGLFCIRLMCEGGPEAMRAANIDCLLADQTEPAAKSVAEKLKLPMISICSALPYNEDPLLPPATACMAYRNTRLAQARNLLAYRFGELAMFPVTRLLNRYRRAWGLKGWHTRLDHTFSDLAQISQIVPEFDLPRRSVPAALHFVGPFQRAAADAPFPFDLLDETPLIFASLGTIQGSRSDLWRIIAESCAGLPAQLVIALGGCGEPEDYRDLPGRPLVLKYAPQQTLLQRAAVFISHAGMNSVMEALESGVPIVALPINGDQNGSAVRIAYRGLGEFVPASRCSVERLKPMVERVLLRPEYREQARRMQQRVRNSGGLKEAAEIIERVLASVQSRDQLARRVHA